MKESSQYSRRDILKRMGATALTAVLTAAAIYVPKYPEVKAQGGTIPLKPTVTPTPEATPEMSGSYWIGDINRYAYYERFPFSLIDPSLSKSELEDIFNQWGGITQIQNKFFPQDFYDVPHVFKAMNQLNLPLTTLICDPNNTKPFLSFFDEENEYSFITSGNGYKADIQPVAHIAGFTDPEMESEPQPETNHYEPQIIIEPFAQASSVSEVIPYDTEYFDEAIKEIVSAFGEGTNQFSQELYPYIRKHYDKKLVDIHSADGMFPYNFDAELFTPDFLFQVMNLQQMGNYGTHSVLIQSGLKVLFPDGYKGFQMNPGDLSRFLKTLGTNTSNKPSVIVYPYSLNDPFIFDRIGETMSDTDVNHTQSIVSISTFNKNLISQFPKKIPKGVVCFTTVRKDSEGKLFIPPNRSYITGDRRMFGFPDITNAVQAQLGAKKEANSEAELIVPYKPVVTAGASLSTMQGAAFIASVTSKLLHEGYSYSEELVMDTLWELCPETKVDEAVLCVPNEEKLREFFGSNTSLPWILS